MGASDFIAKPFQSSLVLARVKSHLRAKRATDGLRRANAVDPLTGVSSRSQFDDSLQREWLRSLRNGDPMALMLIDVDHFKSYGERYGKAKGDTCLRRVADAVSLVVRRPADCLARFGGEQFGLLLPQTARRGAQHIARRILEGVDALALRHDTLSISQRVSVSIGLSVLRRGERLLVEPDCGIPFTGSRPDALVGQSFVARRRQGTACRQAHGVMSWKAIGHCGHRVAASGAQIHDLGARVAPFRTIRRDSWGIVGVAALIGCGGGL